MPARPQVVVTDFLEEPLDHERRILGDLADVTALCSRHEDELAGRIEDADAVMVYHFLGLSQKTLSRLRRCKLIVRCGAGVDNVDHAFAATRGIAVANVPDYGTEEVADSAIGLALALARGFHRLNSRLRAGRGEWSYTQAAPAWRLRGRVFGIVGIGRIGTASALRAKALGMDVAFYDPFAPEGRDKSLGVRRVESLDDLLAQAHVLSFHCPLTPDTRHMLNRDNIGTMRKGAFVVNTARGAVVDGLAVLDALGNGHLGGAAIDVLESEPPPGDDPLVMAWRNPGHPAHDRLILNPHAAFYCEEGLLDMRLKGSENVRRVLLGQPPRNVVNGVA
ncbi:MAG: C-terminal binding protein [Verrucomicrobia bacterium]|nr:C-terminal binding protein [Verrucomicrobiota bacterium]